MPYGGMSTGPIQTPAGETPPVATGGSSGGAIKVYGGMGASSKIDTSIKATPPVDTSKAFPQTKLLLNNDQSSLLNIKPDLGGSKTNNNTANSTKATLPPPYNPANPNNSLEGAPVKPAPSTYDYKTNDKTITDNQAALTKMKAQIDSLKAEGKDYNSLVDPYNTLQTKTANLVDEYNSTLKTDQQNNSNYLTAHAKYYNTEQTISQGKAPTKTFLSTATDWINKELGNLVGSDTSMAGREQRAYEAGTTLQANAHPETIAPGEYLTQGASFGNLNTDLPAPVTAQQKIAYGIGSMFTLVVASPVIEAALVSTFGEIPAVAKLVTELDKQAETMKVAKYLYPTMKAVAQSTLTGGIFGLITKNSQSVAENVFQTAGAFAAFTAIAYPIMAFFKPILTKVGEINLNNSKLSSILNDPSVSSPTVSTELWFKNEDDTRLLKVTSNGIEFKNTGEGVLPAGAKPRLLTSVQVEAFTKSPALSDTNVSDIYYRLKDWVNGKTINTEPIAFETPKNEAPTGPQGATPSEDIHPTVLKETVDSIKKYGVDITAQHFNDEVKITPALADRYIQEAKGQIAREDLVTQQKATLEVNPSHVKTQTEKEPVKEEINTPLEKAKIARTETALQEKVFHNGKTTTKGEVLNQLISEGYKPIVETSKDFKKIEKLQNQYDDASNVAYGFKGKSPRELLKPALEEAKTKLISTYHLSNGEKSYPLKKLEYDALIKSQEKPLSIKKTAKELKQEEKPAEKPSFTIKPVEEKPVEVHPEGAGEKYTENQIEIDGKMVKVPEQLTTKTAVKDLLKGLGKTSIHMKVNADGMLTYADKNNEFILKPEAFGINTDQIKPGDTVAISETDLKEKGSNFRLYDKNGMQAGFVNFGQIASDIAKGTNEKI